MTETALAWPLAVDSNGNLAMSTSQEKIWNDRVAAVLGTRIGERAMRPTYGSTVPNTLFADEHTDGTEISARVRAAFSQWLPELTLESLMIAGPTSDGVLTIKVDYLSPSDTPFSTDVVVGIVSQDGSFFGADQ